MKINEIDDNVIQGPWKKPVEPKKISLVQAFGGKEYAALNSIGVKFIEKPSSFSYIDRETEYHVNVRQIKILEEIIGRKIESYNAYDILNIRPIKTPRGHTIGWSDHPETDADFSKLKQNDETFILWFPPGETEIEKWYTTRNKFSDIPVNKRYLVNRTGATKYIRMWVALID